MLDGGSVGGVILLLKVRKFNNHNYSKDYCLWVIPLIVMKFAFAPIYTKKLHENQCTGFEFRAEWIVHIEANWFQAGTAFSENLKIRKSGGDTNFGG